MGGIEMRSNINFQRYRGSAERQSARSGAQPGNASSNSREWVVVDTKQDWKVIYLVQK
jgi:hypothetical protein